MLQFLLMSLRSTAPGLCGQLLSTVLANTWLPALLEQRSVDVIRPDNHIPIDACTHHE